jgi:hypothetical protein
VARDLLHDVAAYVDLVGLHAPATAPSPEELRSAADALGITAPLLLVAPPRRDAAALLDLAARFAPRRVPVVAAPVEGPGAGDALLLRFGRLLDGDFGADARPARAATDAGRELPAYRFVSGADLGNVSCPASARTNPLPRAVLLTLDAPTTPPRGRRTRDGRTGPSKSRRRPRRSSPSRRPGGRAITLRCAGAPAEAPARVEATVPAESPPRRSSPATRSGGRPDACWKRFSAWNTTSYRIGFPCDRLGCPDDGGAFTSRAGATTGWEEAYQRRGPEGSPKPRCSSRKGPSALG